MTKAKALQVLSVPAYLVLFMLLGAILGLVAWALDWVVQIVRSFL